MTKRKVASLIFFSTFIFRLGVFLALGIILMALGISYPKLGYYGAALIVFDFLVSFIETIRCMLAINNPNVPLMREMKRALDEDEPDYTMDDFVKNMDAVSKKLYEVSLDADVVSNADVAVCVDEFEKICKAERFPEESLLLFESGINESEDDSYVFSLARLSTDINGEYVKTYIRLRFDLNEDLKKLHESILSKDMKCDFFEYVRRSDSYKTIEALHIRDIKTGVDKAEKDVAYER